MVIASEATGWILPRTTVREATPGRWVGGAVGGLVCLSAIVLGRALAAAGAALPPYFGYISADSLQSLGLAGLPIAIIGGRALFPRARSGDMGTALVVGLRFGLLSPPLGALEFVVSRALDSGSVGAVIFLPFFMIVSYFAAVATIPCGLAWALIIRTVPESALQRLDLRRSLRRRVA